MEGVITFFTSPEFWMGLSFIAIALPGPQTKILPTLFRAIAKVVSDYRKPSG